MLTVAFKGLLARKLRLVLTSLAIVIGVAFVSGAFIFTDSLRGSFSTLFDQASTNIDVQVQTQDYKRLQKAKQTNPAISVDLSKVGVSPEVLKQVQAVPGVKRVIGSIFELGVQPLDKKGELVGGQGPPSFGVGWDQAGEDAGVLKLVKGHAPNDHEMMLDKHAMTVTKYQLGDKVRVIAAGGKTETFTLSGVVKFGDLDSLNGVTMSVFSTPTVQRLLGMGDRYSAVDAQAESGVSQTLLKQRIARELGSNYDVITGAEFSQQQQEYIDKAFLSILQNVILAFALVAVFVGAFTIFNTFTIIVSQRTQEFGLLRALGASRRQVLGIVATEGLAVGLLASTLGLAAGFGLAWVLRELINSFAGGGIPESPFPLRVRTVVVAYMVGVLVTLAASLFPALRASRLSPLEAMRSGGSERSARAWVPLLGVAILAVGCVMIAVGLFGNIKSATNGLSLLGGGSALTLIGIALIARILIGPVVRVLGIVFARGTTGTVALRNVLRTRARAAVTASALMIGLALASLALVFYSSLSTSIDNQIDSTVGSADISMFNKQARSTGAGVVSDAILKKVRTVKGVDQVQEERSGAFVRGTTFNTKEKQIGVTGHNPDTLGSDGLIKLKTTSGNISGFDQNGILVNEDEAKKRHLKVGDSVPMAFATGKTRTLKVRAIFEKNPIEQSKYIISNDTFKAVMPADVQGGSFVFITVDKGERPSVVAKRINKRLGKDARYIDVQDFEELKQQAKDSLQPILGMVLGMLALSVVVALFGIATTLALSVFERTREIGLLRAVGATRRQVRRMVRVEAVLVAVFGSILGAAAGVAFAAAILSALRDDGFTFSVSPVSLLLVVFVGFLAGLASSIFPARRAARMDVLQAISHE